MTGKNVDEIGNLGFYALMFATGILFFFNDYISWVVLYILVIISCFVEPFHIIMNYVFDLKTCTKVDLLNLILHILFGVVIIAMPEMFMRFTIVFYGWWLLLEAWICFVNFHVIRQDRLKGGVTQFLKGLFNLLFGFFFVLGPSITEKGSLLTLIAGFYFLFYGFISFIQCLRLNHPDSLLAKKTNWTFSLPVLVNAFLPIRTYVSIRAMQRQEGIRPQHKKEKVDLEVFIYLKGSGFEQLGHVDIAYGDTIYSYGCHDPKTWKLGGTLGDGVLIQVDRKRFLQQGVDENGKVILGYGIRLNEKEKEMLEDRISSLLARSTPWLPVAEQNIALHKNVYEPMDYPSRVFRSTGANFYKFQQGKFKTYFVASTNCVLLADELIRCKDLRLIDLGGFVTPGAYLSFLNNEYLLKKGTVVSRTLYQSGDRIS